MSDMRQFTATPTVEELEAENERLRAALEEIGGWRFPPQGNEQYFDMRYENGREAAAKIAREALAAVEGKDDE